MEDNRKHGLPSSIFIDPSLGPHIDNLPLFYESDRRRLKDKTPALIFLISCLVNNNVSGQWGQKMIEFLYKLYGINDSGFQNVLSHNEHADNTWTRRHH